MTDKISDLLEAAAAHAEPVVRGVDDQELGKRTPCAEYDVRDLLNHLFHVVVNFQALAAKKDSDFSHTPDYLRGDWRGRFAEETGLLIAAWAAPGAEEGSTGAMNLPARTVGSMVLLDLTVHVWDLARATGQDFTPDEAGVRALAALVAQMGPTARQMKVFAEPCPVPGGVTPFEELLASTGRNPRWTPSP
ncbi:TIGR03086 family metal-binding protein [Streptomyces sp. A3M-1-3]|uniref:TIGR03086 family metal-binding protein n=1 Tax=Streptomyces sp. A3M-1-3 TaxID=2962044 RepID=UPI0020B70CFB|nr:TIGR03086 family metal-binding protein [Streptomyces sp. A3M-1-3]MCP3822086.1 TIGR03086 family metal-binding protein [Streptomyces sp. A3M-1-3]